MNDLKTRVEIWLCENGHYFLQQQDDACRHCGSSVVERLEYREGDCIACRGALCPGYAYGCYRPKPIGSAELAMADTEESTPIECGK